MRESGKVEKFELRSWLVSFRGRVIGIVCVCVCVCVDTPTSMLPHFNLLCCVYIVYATYSSLVHISTRGVLHWVGTNVYTIPTVDVGYQS